MRLKEFIKGLIEHNSHYIELRIGNKVLRPCARCFGKVLGFLFSIPLIIFKLPMKYGFILSWLLALPCIVHWSYLKIFKKPGNNKIRFLTGFLLGMGIFVYFFVMDASLKFKILTFLFYETVFGLIVAYNYSKEYNLQKNAIYQCSCGSSCICCPTACANSCMLACLGSLLCCLCFIPLVCLSFSRK